MLVAWEKPYEQQNHWVPDFPFSRCFCLRRYLLGGLVMNNLVWDDSRIPELRELVERAIIDFLEEFSDYNSNDAYHLAVRVGRTLEVEMENIELTAR